MERELEQLLAEIMSLPASSRERLIERLLANSVREAVAPYGEPSPRTATPSQETHGMTSVTVVLPDDLAKRAQDAGLLADTRLAELIQAALQDQTPPASNDGTPGKSGYDVIKHLLGKNRGGSKDLSTNPNHLKDYGR